MRIRTIAGMLAGTMLIAACSDDTGAPQTAPPAQTEAVTDSPADSPAATVELATNDLGELLVDPDGFTLYGFTNDVDGIPSCNEACADAWPPLIVDGAVVPGPGLDAATFATTTRDDGATQVVAGGWPLYRFSGDGSPGDTNGQGSGDVWFAVSVDGTLIGAGESMAEESSEPEEPTGATVDETGPVTTALTDVGVIIVDSTGLSLYGFTNDDGTPTCVDACADAWPPVIINTMDLPAGLDSGVFSVIDRGDGTYQLRAGGWPLYRFAGDATAGDTNGQGSGDVWFVVAPDGSLVGHDESAPATGGISGY